MNAHDFAGNEKSMGFAVAVVARGGEIVVSGLMGGNFGLPMVQWVYKRMTIEASWSARSLKPRN